MWGDRCPEHACADAPTKPPLSDTGGLSAGPGLGTFGVLLSDPEQVPGPSGP